VVGVSIDGHAGRPRSHSQTRLTGWVCVFGNKVALKGGIFRQESPWTRIAMIHEKMVLKDGVSGENCLVMEGGNECFIKEM
jgi:hypothetical protein